MTDLLSEDELAGLKALRELAETLPPYDWQWTTLTGENGPYQSHEDMIEGIAKTIRHSESLGLHAITWNDEDVDGRSSVVCTTGNGPTSPLHAQYIAAVKPSNILRLLSHIDALKAERDGLKEACAPWENGSTEIPDWDSPLHCVFQAGISYTLQQVGAAVGAESWEGGDGSETIEGDVHVEICNILKAADMYEDEIGTHAKIADRATARTAALKEAAEVAAITASEHADMALYGDPDQARRREAMEAMATRIRHAILAIAEVK